MQYFANITNSGEIWNEGNRYYQKKITFKVVNGTWEDKSANDISYYVTCLLYTSIWEKVCYNERKEWTKWQKREKAHRARTSQSKLLNLSLIHIFCDGRNRFYKSEKRR